MAWTTPRDWTAGELVTEAIMDTHIKGNFDASGPHLVARKTSDQSVTSSTVLVSDTALVLPVLASEVWQVTFCVVYVAVGGTGDIKLTTSFPAGGEFAASASGADNGGVVKYRVYNGTTSDTPVFDFLGAGAAVKTAVFMNGVFINGGTGGNLTLRWAQNASNATATTVKAQSTVWGAKLA